MRDLHMKLLSLSRGIEQVKKMSIVKYIAALIIISTGAAGLFAMPPHPDFAESFRIKGINGEKREKIPADFIVQNEKKSDHWLKPILLQGLSEFLYCWLHMTTPILQQLFRIRQNQRSIT